MSGSKYAMIECTTHTRHSIVCCTVLCLLAIFVECDRSHNLDLVVPARAGCLASPRWPTNRSVARRPFLASVSHSLGKGKLNGVKLTGADVRVYLHGVSSIVCCARFYRDI